jgi:hypothetical protein
MDEALSIIGCMDTAYSSLDMVRTIQWQSPFNRLTTTLRHFRKWFDNGGTHDHLRRAVQDLFVPLKARVDIL